MRNVYSGSQQLQRPEVTSIYPGLKPYAEAACAVGTFAGFAGSVSLVVGAVLGNTAAMVGGAVGLAVSSATSASASYLVSESVRQAASRPKG